MLAVAGGAPGGRRAGSGHRDDAAARAQVQESAGIRGAGRRPGRPGRGRLAGVGRSPDRAAEPGRGTGARGRGPGQPEPAEAVGRPARVLGHLRRRVGDPVRRPGGRDVRDGGRRRRPRLPARRLRQLDRLPSLDRRRLVDASADHGVRRGPPGCRRSRGRAGSGRAALPTGDRRHDRRLHRAHLQPDQLRRRVRRGPDRPGGAGRMPDLRRHHHEERVRGRQPRRKRGGLAQVRRPHG